MFPWLTPIAQIIDYGSVLTIKDEDNYSLNKKCDLISSQNRIYQFHRPVIRIPN